MKTFLSALALIVASWTHAQAQDANVTVEFCIPHDNDFDGDGTSDILWTNADNGKRQIYFMQDGQISSIEDVAILENWTVEQVSDFNADCKSDILWRNTENLRLVVWLMNGAEVTEQVELDNRPGSQWSVSSK